MLRPRLDSARETKTEQIREQVELLFRRFGQANREAARTDSPQILRDALEPDDSALEPQLSATREKELHRQDSLESGNVQGAHENAGRRDVVGKTRTERSGPLPVDQIAPPSSRGKASVRHGLGFLTGIPANVVPGGLGETIP